MLFTKDSTQIVDHCTGNCCHGRIVRYYTRHETDTFQHVRGRASFGHRRAERSRRRRSVTRSRSVSGSSSAIRRAYRPRSGSPHCHSLDFGLGFWSGYNSCFQDNNGNQGRKAFGHIFRTEPSTQTTSGSPTSSAGRLSSTGTSASAGRSSGEEAGNDFILVAARVPIGLDLMFNNPNFLEVFFELAPSLGFLPGFGVGVEGGIGVNFISSQPPPAPAGEAPLCSPGSS